MQLKKHLILVFVMGLMAFGSMMVGDVDVQAETTEKRHQLQIDMRYSIPQAKNSNPQRKS